MKEIIIDGNEFSNEDEFYDYLLKVLTFNTFKYDYPYAYQDVFGGSEGWAYGIGEPISVKWINHHNNKPYFGDETNFHDISFEYRNSDSQKKKRLHRKYKSALMSRTKTDDIIAHFCNNANVISFEVLD